MCSAISGLRSRFFASFPLLFAFCGARNPFVRGPDSPDKTLSKVRIFVASEHTGKIFLQIQRSGCVNGGEVFCSNLRGIIYARAMFEFIWDGKWEIATRHTRTHPNSNSNFQVTKFEFNVCQKCFIFAFVPHSHYCQYALRTQSTTPAVPPRRSPRKGILCNR